MGNKCEGPRAVIFVALVWISWCVSADTFYVAPGGSNLGPGTELAPWETLQHAANEMVAGDEVLVADGTYAGFECIHSGTESLPISFRALGDNAVIDHGETAPGDLIQNYMCHFVVIDGFRVTAASRAGIAILGEPGDPVLGVVIRNCTCFDNGRWGIFTGYAEDILIEDNSCSGSGDEHGIYVSNSADRPIIQRNTVFDNAASGIQINADPALPGDGIISEAVVVENVIYGNGVLGGGSINLASVRDSLIANNLIVDNVNSGIAMWDDGFGNDMGCKNNFIYFNTVVMPSGGRWALNMINASTGNIIKNNILLHLGSRGGIETDTSSLTGLITNHNILDKISLDDVWMDLLTWQGMGYDADSFSASPVDLFVDPGNDYHLFETSDAVNQGENLTQIDRDLDGDPRPMDGISDIGCDEYLPPCAQQWSLYLSSWHSPESPPDTVDSNGNGLIDLIEILTFVDCLEP